MPYMRDGKCVYKKKEDGSRGDVVKCHDTEQAAQQHLEALVANVDDAKASGDFKVAIGGTVKSLGGGRVGGYLVMWGDEMQRDLEGEYFTPETDLGLDWFVERPALYHHGLDKTLKSTLIGKIDQLTPDDTGVWVEAQLDLRNQYVQAVLQLVEKGAVGWSSGSLPQLVRVDNGKIIRWPIVEGSITPTPAEPRLTVVPLKSLLDMMEAEGLATAASEDAAGDESVSTNEGESSLSDAPDAEAQPQPAPDEQLNNRPGGEPDNALPPDDGSEQKAALDASRILWVGSKNMDLKQIVLATVNYTLQSAQMTDVDEQAKMQLVDSIVAHMRDGNGTEKSVDVDQMDPVDLGQKIAQLAVEKVNEMAVMREAAKAVAQKNQKPEPESKVPESESHRAPDIQVRTKYHNLSAEDMAFMASLRVAQGKSIGDQQFERELAEKALKNIDKYEYLELDRDGQPQALKALRAIKNDEVINTGQTNYGAEWVPDLWSSDLWRTIRFENRVLSLMNVIDMPSDEYIIPVEYSDPTVYRVPQTEDDSQFNPSSSPVTSSKVGTDNVTLSAKKLGIRVPFSREQEEDSIIRIVPYLRQTMLRVIEEAIEYDILHADPTAEATGNINRSDAEVTSAALDHWTLGFDGICHLPLVEKTNLLVNQAGADPDLTMLHSLRLKLGAVYQARLDDLVYISEPVTATKMVGTIDEILTVDKYGPRATILTGQVGSLFNIPIIVSAQLKQADDADGKLSNTASNNTYGRVLLFHRPSWRVGFRRRVKMELVPFPLADASQLVAFVRLGMVRKDDDAASLAYAIGL